jgi:hypothetical protein
VGYSCGPVLPRVTGHCSHAWRGGEISPNSLFLNNYSNNLLEWKTSGAENSYIPPPIMSSFNASEISRIRCAYCAFVILRAIGVFYYLPPPLPAAAAAAACRRRAPPLRRLPPLPAAATTCRRRLSPAAHRRYLPPPLPAAACRRRFVTLYNIAPLSIGAAVARGAAGGPGGGDGGGGAVWLGTLLGVGGVAGRPRIVCIG